MKVIFMRGEYQELLCPFCNNGKIRCWYIPSVTSFKRERSATFGSKVKRSRTSDILLVQSGCNVCRKSQEEVEKEFKNKGVI